jgi:hypothetical protein
LSIRIQNIKEKNGRITVDISAYQNQNLLTIDSINIMRERERKAFIKKMSLESEIERVLLGKMNYLPRIAKELKQIQRLHREADDWVAKVVQQNVGTSTIDDVEREESLNLLKDPALLFRIGRAIEKLGVAGERRNAITIYLAITSRVLKTPISLLIKGESSSGKSFVPSQVIHLFPKDAYIELTGMSRQALVYSDEAISHRTIIIFEKHGMDQALYNIRTLQSEGKVIFETVQKDPETGKHKTERIEKEGPTNFIVTTTSLKIHHENETRNWSVDVDESEEQTEAVKKKIADKYSNIVAHHSFVNVFQNAQKLLKPYPVKIPFAEFLGARTPNRPIRIRRDFDKLLSAIEVITLLHQYQRPIKEEAGFEYLDATLADYFMAKELFNDLFIWSLSGTNRKTQKAISAVTDLYQKNNSPVTFKDLMAELGKTKQTIQTWLKPAIASGEVEVHDSKGKDPATFIPGVKGEIVSGLPGVEELAQAFPDWVQGFRVVHPLTGEEIVLE